MSDFSQGKIYKIVCNETGETYYGATIQKLSARISKHKAPTNRTTSKEIVERNNYDVVLCECFPCETREQLLERENYWIENNECVNKNSAVGKNSSEYKKHYRDTHQKEIS